MPFIGIISDENTENHLRREIIEHLKLRESSVLFIKETIIENIKNIKFETVIIAKKFENTEILKKLLQNATYIIVNSDIENNLSLIENINATVITYGFNSKASITASSVDEDEVMICLQRTIENKNGEVIEPQEIKMPICENTNCSMALACILLIYKK